jgi:hypothetical protein
MKSNFDKRFTGWVLVIAALLYWLGWILMGHHVGDYFVAEDFSEILSRRHWWIWLFRCHLFGMVLTVTALIAFAGRLIDPPARILIWPGVAVITAGIFITALAQAFYYHFGAWGSVEMNNKSSEQISQYVESLRLITEYVTCLTRFGRVFPGLGMVVFGSGLVKWKIVPNYLGGLAILIGLSAMGLTMFCPDDLHYYTPVFHCYSFWILAMGITILRCDTPTVNGCEKDGA